MPVSNHRQALRPALVVLNRLVVHHRPVERRDKLRLDRSPQHQESLQVEQKPVVVRNCAHRLAASHV